MTSDMLPEFGAGAIFGASLLASGVYSPAVIISQMRLQNFHMLKSFLAASSISALVVKLADRSGWAPCKIRSPSSYGYFPYDANVVGGLLIGTGMTLTGACPGTVVVQAGTGLQSGVYVAVGGLLGGLLYTKFAPLLRRQSAPAAPTDLSGETVQGKLNISADTVFLAYEAMCLAVIALSNAFAPQEPHWLDPVVGGLIIGAAQAATVLMTRRTVGVSTAYQDLARRFWKAVGSSSFPTAKLFTPAVTFAAGVMAGSAALARSGLIRTSSLTDVVSISNSGAMLGGAAMVLGAGLAGGCPSGHGISGMATFSMSSFISVAGMFGGGIAVAQMLRG